MSIQPGGEDFPSGVDAAGGVGGVEVVGDGGDLAVVDGHAGNAVDVLGGVDDARALDDDVVFP